LLNALRGQLTHGLSSSNLFPVCPTIRIESESTHCCGQRLLVQKTEKRSVITLWIGKINIHETVKQCRVCKKTYASADQNRLVPKHCSFGFDVMVYVGKALFQRYKTENEVAEELRSKNVPISEREVSYLAKKFICYLALTHQEKIPEIRKLIEDNGGSCLHFDGTNDGGSPHLIVAVDETEKLVLGSIKALSESTESVSSLLRQVKRDYGDPMALIHDLGKANLSAVLNVFPEVADYVCHFHFLRDIGKDLFGDEDARIRSILQGCGVKGRLKAFIKKLRAYVNFDKIHATNLTPNSLQHLAEIDIAYLLTEWILDFAEESSGYGFPFDRERLVFIQRMQKVSKIIQALPPSQGDLRALREELDEVLEDPLLLRLSISMEKKSAHFDKLRDAMRIAESEGSDGLNDDAMDCDIDVIKTAVEKFIGSEEIQEAVLCDQNYRKMLGQIKKYWDKLFTKPITVTSKNGKTMVIQPQRTNNLMERFFRELNRGSRRRTGGKTLGKVLTTMLAETPLVKNLENAKYEKIILSGCSDLSERFAEIEAGLVREKMKQATQEAWKLPSVVKCLIRMPKLLDHVIDVLALPAAPGEISTNVEIGASPTLSKSEPSDGVAHLMDNVDVWITASTQHDQAVCF
jgi:hypothetical protein